MTGRRASQTGYSKTHPLLLDSNPTLAGVLQQAGYDTAAAVDNANVAASLGFARGFRSYRETWEEPALKTEVDRTLAITRSAVDYFGQASTGPAVLALAPLRQPAHPVHAARTVRHRLPRRARPGPDGS